MSQHTATYTKHIHESMKRNEHEGQMTVELLVGELQNRESEIVLINAQVGVLREGALLYTDDICAS